MAERVHDDHPRPPRPADLAELLGRAGGLWDDVKAHAAREFAPISEEWTRPGKKYSWSLRLKHRARTVCYLLPRPRHFLVAFVLGERAVAAAHQSTLPRSVLEAIDAARPYAEGRGIRIEVRTRKDLAQIRTLAAIKMAN
jgi:hypothetical protein